jgi:hypothetical protein
MTIQMIPFVHGVTMLDGNAQDSRIVNRTESIP